MHLIGVFTVRHTKTIITVFVLLTVICSVMALGVQINLDNTDYLPASSNAKQAVTQLTSDFGMRGSAVLMIHELDPVKVMTLKKALLEIPQVQEVVWLDGMVNLETPPSFWESRIVNSFYKAGYARMNILFSDINDSIETQKGVDAVQAVAGKDAFLAGPAVTSQHMVTRINNEVPIYSAVAVVLIVIILFLSTTSWLEPLLFLISIGASILINMGLNLFSGSVSQTTFSSASILQLAVSMDYSVFLLHRFHEQRAAGDGVKDAMVNAMTLSAKPVLASALTTIAGFFALVFMQFGIGPDLGLVLSRGVALSLLSVLTFLPALVIVTDKWVERWSHRELRLNFKHIAKYAVKARYFGLALLLVLAVVFYLAQGRIQYYYANENILPIDDTAITADTAMREQYGDVEQSIILLPKEAPEKEMALGTALLKIPGVSSVDGLYTQDTIGVPSEFLPTTLTDQFESENSRMMILRTDNGKENDAAFETVKQVRALVYSQYPNAKIAGEPFTYLDLKTVTDRDATVVAWLSVIFILIILLITFRSIPIAVMTVFLIQGAIWTNVGLVYFTQTPMSFISFIIIGAIQLGATVDYAILFLSRYKENRLLMSAKEAAARTISDTGKSIITSSGILMSATFSVYFIASIRTGSELCLFIGRGALISTLYVLLILPGLLVLLDPFIRRGILGKNKQGVSL